MTEAQKWMTAAVVVVLVAAGAIGAGLWNGQQNREQNRQQQINECLALAVTVDGPLGERIDYSPVELCLRAMPTR
jgi:hypothetical protein